MFIGLAPMFYGKNRLCVLSYSTDRVLAVNLDPAFSLLFFRSLQFLKLLLQFSLNGYEIR